MKVHLYLVLLPLKTVTLISSRLNERCFFPEEKSIVTFSENIKYHFINTNLNFYIYLQFYIDSISIKLYYHNLYVHIL